MKKTNKEREVKEHLKSSKKELASAGKVGVKKVKKSAKKAKDASKTFVEGVKKSAKKAKKKLK